MTKQEIEQHNREMIERANKCGATYLEWDGDIIVDFGTATDYDTNAVDVQNGNGYYNENGRYNSYR